MQCSDNFHHSIFYLPLCHLVVPFLLQSLNKKYGSNVPLLLMNSFNTHEDTLKVDSLNTSSSSSYWGPESKHACLSYRLLRNMPIQALTSTHSTRCASAKFLLVLDTCFNLGLPTWLQNYATKLTEKIILIITEPIPSCGSWWVLAMAFQGQDRQGWLVSHRFI